MHHRRPTALKKHDDLANAIVASNLASTRTPSTVNQLAIPYPLQGPGVTKSRTPSPAKHSMPHTLRKNALSDSSDDDSQRHPYGKHRKKRLVRKHPNKHHEGDRKRWRDALTDRERKRYDGVWAANRDIFVTLASSNVKSDQLDPTASYRSLSDRVSNLVVRDVWCRSRLSDVVLENIWELVDGDCIGHLTREEFVVGLWLIDQRLKGRKLPVRVSDSVWKSVRGLQGIRVR